MITQIVNDLLISQALLLVLGVLLFTLCTFGNGKKDTSSKWNIVSFCVLVVLILFTIAVYIVCIADLYETLGQLPAIE